MLHHLTNTFIYTPTHPLYVLVVGLIAGIILAWNGLPLVYLVACIALSILACLLLQNISPRLKAVLVLFPLGIILGYTRFFWQQNSFNDFQFYNSKPITVIGKIEDIREVESGAFKYTLTISLIKASESREKGWQQADGTIQLYTTHLPDVTIRDTILARNVCLKPVTQESFKNHLMRLGVHTTVFVKGFSIKFLSRPPFSIQRWIYQQKTNMLAAMKKKLSPKTFALYSSVFLGNKSCCKNEIEEISDQCRSWGILHFLARSGLHLVMFVLVWETLLKLLPVHFIFKQLILLLLAISYFIFSWSSISFIRAFLVFILYKSCNFFYLQTNIFYHLCLVCFVILLINPIQLFFLDFQLSFALTGALLWFNQLYYLTPKKS